jgi:CheY-like chemotaxis protein
MNDKIYTEQENSNRVLVVEDESTTRYMIVQMLEALNCQVDVAINGKSALEKISNSDSYNLILMDLLMPEMDGYEATRALRKAGFKIPIIALTAHAMTEERDRSIAAGCDAHLTKPLNRSLLIETMVRLTSHKKSNPQLI